MRKMLIRYMIERTDEGWLVWRGVESNDLTQVPSPVPRKPSYETQKAAEAAVESRKRKDLAAATTLGIEIEHRVLYA